MKKALSVSHNFRLFGFKFAGFNSVCWNLERLSELTEGIDGDWSRAPAAMLH